MGVFDRLKDLRARGAMQTARKRMAAEEVGSKEWQAAQRDKIVREHNQARAEGQREKQEARIERETQKLEHELPLLQHQAEAVKLREQIRVARERVLAGPHADLRSMHTPGRGVSDVHSGFFGGGRRRQQTQPQPPTSLTGFEFGFGIKQPGSQPQEKKKQRYGAFGEPL